MTGAQRPHRDGRGSDLLRMAHNAQQIESDNVIANRFELIRKLGEGGYGVVYEALDRETRARVALKTLQRMDPDALRRFKEEFRSLQDLEHPNLVLLSELMCADGLWFFTMELIEGTDFFNYVRPSTGTLGTRELRSLEVRKLRHALAQLADALIAVHASGRVHCDIKPTNIRVDRTGRVVLLDFGLVTPMATPDAEPRTENALGTPAYMSPEQCRGESVTAAADWYGLGVLLYEALTGSVPFTGHVAKILVDKQRSVPRHPREIDPEAPEDLAELCMQLLRINPAERPNGATVLGVLLADNDALSSDALSSDANGRKSYTDVAERARFIGRKRERELLHDHFARTHKGKPALAYIAGESGVGKSALARCFAEELRLEAGAVVLRSRCYERETVPYKAFDGIVDDLARYLAKLEPRRCRALLPPDARLLTQIFPVLTSVKALLALPVTRTPLDPKVLRSLAFAALRDILARIAGDVPLLLFIDDLQWTDLDSLSLLDELLNGAEAPACMVVATGRPTNQLASELRDAVEQLLRLDMSLVMPLEGLAVDEAEELVRALARSAWEAELARKVAEEAKGHPLFVAELVRHVDEGRALGETRHLDEALSERVNALNELARGVLETLAVASTPTSHAVLARALEIEATDLRRRLAQLRTAHLVRSEGKNSAECYHDRVRRAVLDALPEGRKRTRHRALAGALSQIGGVDAEQIAYQWRCAGDLQRAARYCAEAAEAADRALAFKRAARLYDEALAMPEAFDPERISQLKVAHARALSCAGFAGRAAEVYLEASLGRSDHEARALRRRATQLFLRSARLDKGLKLADEVLAEFGLSRPTTPTRAVLRLAWERTRLAAGGIDRPNLKLRDDQRTEDEALDLLWAVGPSLAFVDFLGGSALQSMYARMALASGHVQHVVRSLTNEALLFATMEKPPQPKVMRLLEQVRKASDMTNQPYHRALVWMAHGYVHWVNFRLSEAVPGLVQAERLLREQCVDVAWELTNARFGLLNALWNNGRLWQHDEFASEWRRDAMERGDKNASTQLVVIGLGYQVGLRRGQPDESEELLRQSLEGWPTAFQLTHWSQYIGRQLVALYRGDGNAYALLRETWPVIRRSQLLKVPYFALLTHCDAAWACVDELTRAPADEQRRLAYEIADHTQAILKTRWPLSQAFVDQITAQTHLALGRHDAAMPLLVRAEASMRAAQSVYQHPTAYLAGQVMGGEIGRAMCARAVDWAEREGIADPIRWFSMFSPILRVNL